MEHDPLQDLGHNAPYKKLQIFFINIYNGQNKKVSGHTTANHARIYKYNFIKLTKIVSNQTWPNSWAHMYDTSRYTANTKM